MALSKYKAVIQIRGCFWHSHSFPLGKPPKSNVNYWGTKLAKTRVRDAKNDNLLRKNGSRDFVICECTLKSEKDLNIIADKLATDLLGRIVVTSECESEGS